MKTDKLPKAAFILCHGIGEHCFPFGGIKALRPKYAHEVGNIPLVSRIANELLALKVNRIFIVTGFRGEVIQKLFQNPPEAIRFLPVQAYAHGDGNALTEALQACDHQGDAWVVNGDLLTFGRDYPNMLSAYSRLSSQSLLLCDEFHPEEDRQSWVSLELNQSENQATRILKHSPDGKYRLSGMALFCAADIARLKAAPVSDDAVYLGDRLSALNQPFAAVKSVEPLVHVDRAFDYLEANQVLIQRAADAIQSAQGVYVYVGGEGEPNPEFIFPGTIIEPGARIVFEEGSFIGPYTTKAAHIRYAKSSKSDVLPIRIRGHVHLQTGARIGLNAIIEGNLILGPESYVEDSVVEQYVLTGRSSEIRRNAVVRGFSVCGDRTRFECGADFEGVAGNGTIYMHPGQCWIVTGQECDLGAGNFFGTWRFDSGRCRYRIGDRVITPKCDQISNASFIGDRVRTAIGVFFAPGTRVGANSLIGAGYLPSGAMDAGYGYLAKQETMKVRVGFLRK